MSEFVERQRNYERAKRLRAQAAEERNPERRAQMLGQAVAAERRGRGYGTLKGKNVRGER